MQLEDLKLLFHHLKNDDDEAFTSLIEKNRAYNISFGRFPLLSVMYMYNSKNLLKHFKERLYRVVDYDKQMELSEIYIEFKSIAKRSIRLYTKNQIVTPFEMLLIKGDNVEFLKFYKNTSKEEFDRLNLISKIVTGKEIICEDDKLVLPKRPLTRQRKLFFNHSIAIMCVTVLISLIMGIYAVASNQDIKKNGLGIINQKMFSNSLNSELDYLFYLDRDFTIDMSKWNTTELKVELNGNNHTITIEGDLDKPLFKNLENTIKDVNFVIKSRNISSELITEISSKGTLKNCSFDYLGVSVKYKDHFSFINRYNLGTIEDIKINVSGKMIAENDESITETKYLQVLCEENIGTINNIELKENLNIQGIHFVNYEFSSICGKNCSYRVSVLPTQYIYGKITNVNIVTSKLTTSLIDISGICSENSGYIENSKLDLIIKNTNNTMEWNPCVAGVVLRNYMYVKEINYNGSIWVETNTTKGYILLGGICAENTGSIENCLVNANINAIMQNQNSQLIYVGGIVANNGYYIEKCKFKGDIKINSKNSQVIVGGLVGRNFYTLYYQGKILSSISEGKIIIENQYDIDIYAGGIAGFNVYYIEDCISLMDYNITQTEKTFLGGLVGTMANAEYSEEMLNDFVSVNIYYKVGSMQGVCGFYEKIENELVHSKFTSDFLHVLCFENIEMIKKESLYW